MWRMGSGEGREGWIQNLYETLSHRGGAWRHPAGAASLQASERLAEWGTSGGEV